MENSSHHSAAAEYWQGIERQLDDINSLEYTNTSKYLQEAQALLSATTVPDAPVLLRVAAFSELGNAYRANGKFPEAVEQLQQAARVAQEVAESEQRTAAEALIHLRMAIVGDTTGNLVLAFDRIDQAAVAYREIGDENGLARCNLITGVLYLRLEDYSASEQAYREALAHYREVGQTDRVAISLVNLTTVLLHQHRYAEAVVTAREALPIANSPLLKAAVTGGLGNALSGLGELDEALRLFESTWDSLEALGDPNHLITYKRAVGTILAKQQRFPEAIEFLEEALAMAIEYEMDGHATLCHGQLAQAHGDAGDFERAYHYQREYYLRVLENKAKIAAHQLELHKWRMKVLAAEQRMEELEVSSYRDFLTKLANRRSFDLQLEELTQQAITTKRDFGVLALDIDRFKRVNDKYGHLLGDDVLRAVATIMLENTRHDDVVARVGGEEFFVLLRGPLNKEQLHAIAEKIRIAFLNYDWNPIAKGLLVSVSIGGALFSEANEDPIQALELADRRLYKAKGAGRNRVWTVEQGS